MTTAMGWMQTVSHLAAHWGWVVDQAPNSRSHRATHVLLRGGYVLAVYARTTENLLAGQQESYDAWVKAADASVQVNVRVWVPGDMDEVIGDLRGVAE